MSEGSCDRGLWTEPAQAFQGPKQNLIWGPPPTTVVSPVLDNYRQKCHTIIDCIYTVADYELLSLWAQMRNFNCIKVGANGGRGVLPQKILNLVDVISCILVPFWDGQLEKGNT